MSFQNYRDSMKENTLQNRLIRDFPNLFEARMAGRGGYEVGPGWHDIVYNLVKVLSQDVPDIKILQIKEKFGHLRVYYSGEYLTKEQNILVENLISAAEDMCAVTCEFCGSVDDTVKTRGPMWLKTVCDNCQKTREN